MDDQELSIEDTMGAAFDAANATPEADAVDVTEVTDTGQARDEAGRFIASETDSDAEVVEESDTTEALKDEAEEAAPEDSLGELTSSIQAPSSWTEANQEVFSALPPEVQEILVERESQFEKGINEKAQELAKLNRQYEPIEPVLAQRRAQFEREGVSEAEGLKGLFDVSDFAAQKPVEFIQWFAGQRGIDLATFAQPGGESKLDGDDPYMAEIRRIQDEHKRELAQLRQEQQGQQEAQVRAANQARVDSFKSETNEAGELLRPHFDAVQEHMSRLIYSGLATDLSDAYEQACRLHPQVSQQFARQTQEQQEAERLKEQKRAADRAKRAIGKLKSPGSGRRATPAPASTPEKTMAEVYDSMNAA